MIVPLEASGDVAGDAGVVTCRVDVAADDVHEALLVGMHGGDLVHDPRREDSGDFWMIVVPSTQRLRQREAGSDPFLRTPF